MDIDYFGGRNFQFPPFTIPIITPYIIVGLHIPEWKFRPVNIFHISSFYDLTITKVSYLAG